MKRNTPTASQPHKPISPSHAISALPPCSNFTAHALHCERKPNGMHGPEITRITVSILKIQDFPLFNNCYLPNDEKSLKQHLLSYKVCKTLVVKSLPSASMHGSTSRRIKSLAWSLAAARIKIAPRDAQLPLQKLQFPILRALIHCSAWCGGRSGHVPVPCRLSRRRCTRLH